MLTIAMVSREYLVSELEHDVIEVTVFEDVRIDSILQL